MEHGNGRKLMDAFYAKYNIEELRRAATPAPRWAAGTARRSRAPADLKGLKMRLGGGLFGEAMAQAGRGAAEHARPARSTRRSRRARWTPTEFVGPYDDEKLGFNKVAPFYYYPGWWEGGAELEFFINAKAYDGLVGREQGHRRRRDGMWPRAT